jgi:protein-tyrosine phosphatase
MPYDLTWITNQLAVGHAPMFDVDLEVLRDNGIDAIVNLCGEFCDLHELQSEAGFEVHYLPIADECAPDIAAMETAFAWVDDVIAQGRKVLVHCRFGVGRTGTFVTAYLMKKGLHMKAAAKALKHSRANPTQHCQWKLLRAFGKKLKQS